MQETAQESWLINVDSFDFPGEEHQDFAKGQVLDFAISASVGCCTPSDERQIYHTLRREDYDVNARILSVTRMEGDDEDVFLSVFDFGLRAYTYAKIYEGVLERCNYWISARIGLNYRRLNEGKRSWFPLVSHFTHKWQIENIYWKVNQPDDQESPTATPEKLEEITEFRMTRFEPEEGWSGGPWKIPALLLKCKRIGRADPVPV